MAGKYQTKPVTQERIDYLKTLFDYNPETGVFVSKVTRGVGGSVTRPGDVIGCRMTQGYMTVRVDAVAYKLHRLAWMFMCGPIEWLGEIDHVNGVRSDNRISNLRVLSASENSKHTHGPRIDSTTNIRGVYEVQHGGKTWFRVVVGLNSKTYHIGYFKTKVEAAVAATVAKYILHGGLGFDTGNPYQEPTEP